MKGSDRASRGGGRRDTLFRDGYYARRAAKVRGIWLLSAALALLCTFITYPGIWYSDSYVRVTTGGAFLNAIVKTLTGHRAYLYTGNAFSLAPSFFMALSMGLTGHVGLYTFCQAFLFFAATFLLIRELTPGRWKLQAFLFACCPLIYGMSVYYEAGIGCVTGIAALILLIRRAGDEKGRGDRILEFLMVAFFSFVTFGYRTNALTVLPVLGWAVIRIRADRKRKGAVLLALLLGLGMIKGIPWIFDVHSDSTASAGIVWEMLTAIQRIPEEERGEYEDYLDELGGEGATRAALSQSTEDTAGSFMWGDDLGMGKLSAPGATAGAVRKYAELMFRRPGEWWGVKRDVIARSLGLTWTLDYSEYNYDRWGQMAEYGMNDSAQRRAFHDSFTAVCGGLGWLTLHPWVSFLLTLILTGTAWLRKEPGRSLHALVAWTAAFYYLAYLLDTPAYDYRYFYPSLYLMMILDAALLLDWGRQAVRRIRGRGGKGGEGLAAAGGHSRVQ